MDVTEALAFAETDLANTLDELRMARELVAALEQDVKKFQIEIVGLKSYTQRKGLSASTMPESTIGGADVVPISADLDLTGTQGPDIALLSRTDAVAAVMRLAPGPLDRNAISEQFADAGRFDSINDISLSLSGLKRAGRAEKLGQGLWQLAEEAPAAEARR